MSAIQQGMQNAHFIISFVERVTLFLQFLTARTFAQVLLDAIFSSASGLSVGLQDLGLNEKCFNGFYPQKILDEGDQAFNAHSRLFQNTSERRRLQKLAEKYGARLFPEHPLGYGNTQAMIAWQHTGHAPNNSLPIIWAGPRNEAKIAWKPMFERVLSASKAARKGHSENCQSPKGEIHIELTSNFENSTQSLRNEVDAAIKMHKEGNIAGYRSFVSKSQIINRLKRSAHFELLRELAEVDLAVSTKTRHARSILSYIQSCLVLYDLESAITVFY